MSSVPETPGMAVRCSASGAKWVGGSMSDDTICTRFMARLGLEIGDSVTDGDARIAGDGISIALHFHRLGWAVAEVTRYSNGVAHILPTRERTAMDRPLSIDDVDRLADDVAADLGSESQS